MSLRQPQIPAEVLEAVIAIEPGVQSMAQRTLPGGWDCQAWSLGERLVVKVPRGPDAAERLNREVSLLGALKGKVSLTIPEPVLLAFQPTSVVYPMIPGEPLLPDRYRQLDVRAKDRLAHDLGQLISELHAANLPAHAVGAWPAPEDIVARVLPDLPRNLRLTATALVDEVLSLPPDADVFGHFDLHGWNMAFDHNTGRLNGVFDFGDCGRGPLHRDHVYPSLTDPDLARRIAALQPVETGRLRLLAGLHRLFEAGDPVFTDDQRAANLQSALDWLSSPWEAE